MVRLRRLIREELYSPVVHLPIFLRTGDVSPNCQVWCMGFAYQLTSSFRFFHSFLLHNLLFSWSVAYNRYSNRKIIKIPGITLYTIEIRKEVAAWNKTRTSDKELSTGRKRELPLVVVSGLLELFFSQWPNIEIVIRRTANQFGLKMKDRYYLNHPGKDFVETFSPV